MATLVTFRIAGWTAAAALAELGARVFAIARTIDSLDALRISVGFFTSDEELERFAEAVALLAAHTPETLPPRRTLAILVAEVPATREGATGGPMRGPGDRPVRRRSWAEVRWRQFRNAPRPVVRAVAASLVVAIVLAIAYLAYDVALEPRRGAAGRRPADAGGRALRRHVLVAGTVLTYLVVPQPTGLGDRRTTIRLERRARVLRGRPDRLPRHGRRRAGHPPVPRLTSAHRNRRAGRRRSGQHRYHPPVSLATRQGRWSGHRPFTEARIVDRGPRLSVDEQHTSRCQSSTARPRTRARLPVVEPAPRPFDRDELPHRGGHDRRGARVRRGDARPRLWHRDRRGEDGERRATASPSMRGPSACGRSPDASWEATDPSPDAGCSIAAGE